MKIFKLVLPILFLFLAGCTKTYKFDLDGSIEFASSFIKLSFFDMDYEQSSSMMHQELGINSTKLQALMSQVHPYGYPDTIKFVSYDAKDAISPIHFVLYGYIGNVKRLYVLTVFKGTSDKYLVTGLNFIPVSNESAIHEKLNVSPITKDITLKESIIPTKRYSEYQTRKQFFIIPDYNDVSNIKTLLGAQYEDPNMIRKNIGFENIIGISQIYDGKTDRWGLSMTYKTMKNLNNEPDLIKEAEQIWKTYGIRISNETNTEIFVLSAVHTIDDLPVRSLFTKDLNGEWNRKLTATAAE